MILCCDIFCQHIWLLHIVCLWLNTIRCIKWAAAAKKFVDEEICWNILCLVGFRVVYSPLTSADIKLEVEIVDIHGDDGLLTMDEFKLCHGILNQNWKSLEDTKNVTNRYVEFGKCVSCRFGVFYIF